MAKLFLLLLVFMSASASAEWLKMKGASDSSPEKFIDTETIRQTGPMNTMRRVWELNHLAERAPNKVLSTKNQVEYDCKDRRFRVLEESTFSEHWAKGMALTSTGVDINPGNWRAIGKGSVTETIFNRVCPNDY